VAGKPDGLALVCETFRQKCLAPRELDSNLTLRSPETQSGTPNGVTRKFKAAACLGRPQNGDLDRSVAGTLRACAPVST
jgi:hypothetical protein